MTSSAQPFRPGLSKSRITAFEQCPKRLWLMVHRPELAEQDADAEARFATGHEVGAAACALHPSGVMIEAVPDLAAALAETRALLDGGHAAPIFEATFAHQGVLVRVDVMEPVGEGAWHVAEVKASCAAKPYHWADLATQLWVLEGAGVKLASAAIRHLDRTFRLDTEGALDGLFVDAPAGEAVKALVEGRGSVVAEAQTTLVGPEPIRDPGDHCSAPFACEFQDYCNRHLPPPPEWPIALLPHSGRKLAAEWAARGEASLTALPLGTFTSARHDRVHRATLSGEPYHDVARARATTAHWAAPRIWLDFETISFAVPRWVGTGPYTQVPFQFSAHVEAADGTVLHVEHLSLDGGDPRPGIATSLANLPQTGVVIAYNAAFERRCLQDLAEAVPEHRTALIGLADRLVDLLPVARDCYYHRDQRGSWSIKAVLPTIAPELDYAALEVKDGMVAQEAYLEAIHPATTPARRLAIDAALRAYCGRDSWAMVVLWRRLCGAAA